MGHLRPQGCLPQTFEILQTRTPSVDFVPKLKVECKGGNKARDQFLGKLLKAKLLGMFRWNDFNFFLVARTIWVRSRHTKDCQE